MSIPCITIERGTITCGNNRMSVLSVYVREEMDRQGINQLELARRSDIPNSTLDRYLDDLVEEWKPSIILKIAEGLGVPFWRLMTLAGYPTDAPGDWQSQDRRLLELTVAFPWMRPMVEDIAELTPEDREAVLAYLETLRHRRERRSKP